MNLLFTLTAYPPSVGGAQLHMHQLARELACRHRLQVVTQWDESRTDWLMGTTLNAPQPERAYEVDGIPVQRISLPDSARHRLAPWVVMYFPLQRWALPNIADALTTEINRWAQNAELIHNCRIGREGLSFASLKVARQRGIPFVFTPVHHPRWGGWLHRYYHRLYREADAVIALTEAERQLLIGLGVEEQKVFVTGHGPILADAPDGARFRSRFNLNEAPLVLFLGQKYPYKGIRQLLDAANLVWRRIPEVRFAFVGPRTTYSIGLFATVTDKRVLEVGEVDLQMKTDALAACDILCLPSTQESFGGVFTEAWSMGKPVVGCDISAVRNVVDDGADGFLVPQESSALAERLIYLLERPRLREEMGSRGRDKVNRLYTWERLAEQTEQVYRQVLSGL
ncbi:MAG: glycosyltransferase family 4 protein [Chloroflexi bacterium]|nr:glycosyltransferase family 4 protein [Chloroflexota bacterium]